MADRTGEAERIRQKKFRDKKRADGYVHLHAWVSHKNRNKVKQFIKEIEQLERR